MFSLLLLIQCFVLLGGGWSMEWQQVYKIMWPQPEYLATKEEVVVHNNFPDSCSASSLHAHSTCTAQAPAGSIMKRASWVQGHCPRVWKVHVVVMHARSGNCKVYSTSYSWQYSRSLWNIIIVHCCTLHIVAACRWPTNHHTYGCTIMWGWPILHCHGDHYAPPPSWLLHQNLWAC